MYVYKENKHLIAPVCALKIAYGLFPHRSDTIHIAEMRMFLFLFVSETGYIHVRLEPTTELSFMNQHAWMKAFDAWYRTNICFEYYLQQQTIARRTSSNVHTNSILPHVQLYETRTLQDVLTSPLLLGFVSDTNDCFRIKLQHIDTPSHAKEWVATPTYKMRDGRYFTPFYQNRWSIYVGYMFLENVVVAAGKTKNILCASCDMAPGCSMLNTKNNTLDGLDSDMHRLDIGYELDRRQAKERCAEMHHVIFKDLMEAVWHPKRVEKMSFEEID